MMNLSYSTSHCTLVLIFVVIAYLSLLFTGRYSDFLRERRLFVVLDFGLAFVSGPTAGPILYVVYVPYSHRIIDSVV